MSAIPPEREAQMAQFAQIIGPIMAPMVAQAVADALAAKPPVTVLPEHVTQALMQLVQRLNMPQPFPQQAFQQPFQPQPMMPLSPFQVQQMQQAAMPVPKAHVVERYDENGNRYYEEVTVPQLLAEMCDLLGDLVDAKFKRRKKAG